ncbi:MAG: glycosyltransferase family 2 protein [Thermodesulfobacteriota bacterium]|nr:glycosyltransferase family 2 protein [Thermodesulfobacteriota bacterium]
MPGVDIIVPVYNEEKNIVELIRRIRNVCPDGTLVFVDNASTDNSVKVIEGFPFVKLLKHERNKGYGNSLYDGIKNSTGEIIIIIDADLEYPPEAIPAMVKHLEKSDVVFGSRFLNSSEKRMSNFRSWGNKIITRIFNILFGYELTDLYTGMRGIRRSVISHIEFKRSGFDFVLELAAKLAKDKIKIDEIAIEYCPRNRGQSKMKHIPEAIKYFFLIITYKMFLPSKH